MMFGTGGKPMSPKPLDKSVLLALGLVGTTACVCLDVVDSSVCLSEEPDTDTDADSDTDTDICLSAQADDPARFAPAAGGAPLPAGELEAIIERLDASGVLPSDVAEQIG
jgi:hypothetical protein